MNTTETTPADRLRARAAMYQTTKAKIDSAFDECGIGHDAQDRLRPIFKEIGEFCASLQEKSMSQAVYDRFTNVPQGIMARDEANAEHAIKRAVVSSIGAFVRWDINGALEIAADILEDVNAHGEASIVRNMISKAA